MRSGTTLCFLLCVLNVRENHSTLCDSTASELCQSSQQQKKKIRFNSSLLFATFATLLLAVTQPSLLSMESSGAQPHHIARGEWALVHVSEMVPPLPPPQSDFLSCHFIGP